MAAAHQRQSFIVSETGLLWKVLVVVLLILIKDAALAVAAARWERGGKSSQARPTSSSSRGADAERIVEGLRGAVAADEGRCSVIGKDVMEEAGGNAVDAAVATALCLGVLNPMASGIGGGGFLLLYLADSGQTIAYDLREVAPTAASEEMYSKDNDTQTYGELSMGVPGEVAGLHLVWQQHGSLPWESLFQPAIKFAEGGFVVRPYLAHAINLCSQYILADEGLKEVFAPNGTILQVGDVCYNKALARTLRAIATEGPDVFYKGVVGRKLIEDVQAAGGILTMEDLNVYEVKIREPIVQDVKSLTVIGMPPPSTGPATMIMALNILAAYPDPSQAVSGSLGLHRMIEAFKHAYAVHMNLGDPDFVNNTEALSAMLNVTFAAELHKLISDSRTYPPSYYGGRWNLMTQLEDHGTGHLNVVDEDRNAVSMTTTINMPFGAKILSRSTGIILNNEMDEFSLMSNGPHGEPSLKNNLIMPFKRPLSSMCPIIVLKDGQFLGALGGSGGSKIITTVAQVFVNLFWKGFDPLDSVTYARLHHQLIPDIIEYEDWTTPTQDRTKDADTLLEFLQSKGHNVTAAMGAMAEIIVQDFSEQAICMVTEQEGRKRTAMLGKLIAVSDFRKDGSPAAF